MEDIVYAIIKGHEMKIKVLTEISTPFLLRRPPYITKVSAWSG